MTADALDTDRRRRLRAFAEDIDDIPAPMAAKRLRRWTDPTLTYAARDAAWEQLTADVALLDGLRAGMVEPRDIAPGARPSEAYTIADEVLEQNIGRSLDILTGSDRDATFERQAAEAYEAMLQLDRPIEERRAERAARSRHAPVLKAKCPECSSGRQVVGRPDLDTGDHPARCDAGCGWTA